MTDLSAKQKDHRKRLIAYLRERMSIKQGAYLDEYDVSLLLTLLADLATIDAALGEPKSLDTIAAAQGITEPQDASKLLGAVPDLPVLGESKPSGEAPQSNFILALALEYSTQREKQEWKLDREQIEAIVKEHLYCSKLASRPVESKPKVPMAMLKEAISTCDVNYDQSIKSLCERWGFIVEE